MDYLFYLLTAMVSVCICVIIYLEQTKQHALLTPTGNRNPVFRVDKQILSGNNFYIILIAAAILIALLIQHSVFDFTIDDAFITLRYAKNFATHNKLTWNIQDKIPTEGYSTFLWAVLCSLAFKLNLDGLLFAKLLSTFLSIINIVLLWLVTTLLNGRKTENLVPVFCLAFCHYYHFWAVAGMENHLYILLILSSLYMVVLEEKQQRLYKATPILLFLLGITRTEGPIFFAAVVFIRIILVFYDNNSIFKLKNRNYLMWLGTFLILYLAYFIGRAVYYHSLFPLSVYIKKKPFGGLRYVMDFLSVFRVFVFLFIGTVLVKLVNREKTYLYPVGYLLTFLCFIGVFVSPIMGGYFRLLLPAIPLLYLNLSPMLFFITEKIFNYNRFNVFVNTIMVVIVLNFLFINIMHKNFAKDKATGLAYVDFFKKVHIPLGKYLAKNAPKAASVALADAGAIPYYSGSYTIDFYGLNNRYFAKNGFDLDTLMALNPTHYVFRAIPGAKEFKGTNTFYGMTSEKIYRHKNFKNNYYLEKVFAHPSYCLYLYKRRQLDELTSIKGDN